MTTINNQDDFLKAHSRNNPSVAGCRPGPAYWATT